MSELGEFAVRIWPRVRAPAGERADDDGDVQVDRQPAGGSILTDLHTHLKGMGSWRFWFDMIVRIETGETEDCYPYSLEDYVHLLLNAHPKKFVSARQRLIAPVGSRHQDIALDMRSLLREMLEEDPAELIQLRRNHEMDVPVNALLDHVIDGFGRRSPSPIEVSGVRGADDPGTPYSKLVFSLRDLAYAFESHFLDELQEDDFELQLCQILESTPSDLGLGYYLIFDCLKGVFKEVRGIAVQRLIKVEQLKSAVTGNHEGEDSYVLKLLKKSFTMLGADGNHASPPEISHRYRMQFTPEFAPRKFALRSSILEQRLEAWMYLLHDVLKQYHSVGVRYVEFSLTSNCTESPWLLVMLGELNPVLQREVDSGHRKGLLQKYFSGSLEKRMKLWKSILSQCSFSSSWRTEDAVDFRFLLAWARTGVHLPSKSNCTQLSALQGLHTHHALKLIREQPAYMALFSQCCHEEIERPIENLVRSTHALFSALRSWRRIVVGFDLHGDESGYPYCPFTSMQFATCLVHFGLGVRVHGGENIVFSSLQKVDKSIHRTFETHMHILSSSLKRLLLHLSILLGSMEEARKYVRIGHGVGMVAQLNFLWNEFPKHPMLDAGQMDRLDSYMTPWAAIGLQGVPVEMNVTSNFHLVSGAGARNMLVRPGTDDVIAQWNPKMLGTDDDGIWLCQPRAASDHPVRSVAFEFFQLYQQWKPKPQQDVDGGDFRNFEDKVVKLFGQWVEDGWKYRFKTLNPRPEVNVEKPPIAKIKKSLFPALEPVRFLAILALVQLVQRHKDSKEKSLGQPSMDCLWRLGVRKLCHDICSRSLLDCFADTESATSKSDVLAQLALAEPVQECIKRMLNRDVYVHWLCVIEVCLGDAFRIRISDPTRPGNQEDGEEDVKWLLGCARSAAAMLDDYPHQKQNAVLRFPFSHDLALRWSDEDDATSRLDEDGQKGYWKKLVVSSWAKLERSARTVVFELLGNVEKAVEDFLFVVQPIKAGRVSCSTFVLFSTRLPHMDKSYDGDADGSCWRSFEFPVTEITNAERTARRILERLAKMQDRHRTLRLCGVYMAGSVVLSMALWLIATKHPEELQAVGVQCVELVFFGALPFCSGSFFTSLEEKVRAFGSTFSVKLLVSSDDTECLPRSSPWFHGNDSLQIIPFCDSLLSVPREGGPRIPGFLQDPGRHFYAWCQHFCKEAVSVELNVHSDIGVIFARLFNLYGAHRKVGSDAWAALKQYVEWASTVLPVTKDTFVMDDSLKPLQVEAEKWLPLQKAHVVLHWEAAAQSVRTGNEHSGSPVTVRMPEILDDLTGFYHMAIIDDLLEILLLIDAVVRPQLLHQPTAGGYLLPRTFSTVRETEWERIRKAFPFSSLQFVPPKQPRITVVSDFVWLPADDDASSLMNDCLSNVFDGLLDAFYGTRQSQILKEVIPQMCAVTKQQRADATKTFTLERFISIMVDELSRYTDVPTRKPQEIRYAINQYFHSVLPKYVEQRVSKNFANKWHQLDPHNVIANQMRDAVHGGYQRNDSLEITTRKYPLLAKFTL
jgi:hypothetical protein